MAYINDLGRGDCEGKIRDLTQRVDSLETYGNNALAIIAAGAVPGPEGPEGPTGNPGGNVMSVGPFSSVGGMTISAGTSLIQTSGPTRGILVEDTSLTDADVTAHPLAIVKTQNGRYFRRDLFGLNVRQFGAVAVPPKNDGSPADVMPDCYQAFIAALAYLRRLSVGIPFYQSSATLLVPAGWYYCSQTINLVQAVTIRGEGTGLEGGQRSVIVNDANVSGIVLYDSSNSGTGTSAAGTLIEGICVYARTVGATLSSQACGIWLRCRATIRDCIGFGYAMDNFSVRASSDGFSDPVGNANLWRIEDCTGYSAGRANFWVSGYDANAGTLINPNAVSAGQWGWFVSGFLTNTIVGGHSASNGGATAGIYPTTSTTFNAGAVYYVVYGQEAAAKTTAPGTNDSVWRFLRASASSYPDAPQWVNGGPYVSGGAGYVDGGAEHIVHYSEGGQPPYWVGVTGTVRGGTPGSGIDGAGTWDFLNVNGRNVKGPARHTSDKATGGRQLIVDDLANGFVRNLTDTGDLSAVSFQFQEILGGGAFRLSYNQGTVTYTTGLNPTETVGQFGTGVAQPRVFAPITLGKFDLVGNNGRREWVDTGPPTTGRFARGDHIRNINPAVGQPKGWFCTAAGIPGTWVADSNL